MRCWCYWCNYNAQTLQDVHKVTLCVHSLVPHHKATQAAWPTPLVAKMSSMNQALSAAYLCTCNRALHPDTEHTEFARLLRHRTERQWNVKLDATSGATLTAACATGQVQGSSGRHIRDNVTHHAGPVRTRCSGCTGLTRPAVHDSGVGLLCCLINRMPDALRERQVGKLAVGLSCMASQQSCCRDTQNFGGFPLPPQWASVLASAGLHVPSAS